MKLNLCPDFPAQASNALSPASQSVCVNGAVGQLTGPAVVIPSASLPLIYRNNVPTPQNALEARYQWQEATAPGGPWADITGAVQRSYTPAPVVTKRYFRRLARQTPACGGAVVQTSTVASILIGTNNAPSVNAGESYVTCPGSPVTLTSTVTGGLAPYTYDWDKGAPDVANPSVSPTENTIYTLTVTDANGCVQLDQAIVNTYAADAGPATAGFCGITGVRIGSAPIAGLAGVTYAWSPAAGLSCTDCAQPLASPAVSTVYTLTVTITKTGGATCQTTDNITVNPVVGPTGLFAGPDVTVCLGQTAQLGTPAQAGFSYTWAPGNYLNSNQNAQTTYQPGNLSLPFPNPIQYYVTAFRQGCTFVDSTIATSIEARADIDGCGPRSLGLPDRTPNLNETYQWVKISGPGTFTGPTNVPVTNVSASVGGDTEYELRVTLNGVTCTDRVSYPPPASVMSLSPSIRLSNARL